MKTENMASTTFKQKETLHCGDLVAPHKDMIYDYMI